MKKLTAEQIEAAAWSAALVPEIVDEVPPGWLTAAQVANKTGKSRHTVNNQLSEAVRAGRAEMQKFKILTGRGVYPVPHYRLK